MSVKKDLERIILEVIGFENLIKIVVLVMVSGFISGTILGLFKVNSLR